MRDDVNESDWKLFRERIAGWQEAFMETLIAEYAIILQDGTKAASERFWEIEKRIKEDKKYYGVCCERKRSVLSDNMVQLYMEGTIDDEDLVGFSDELVADVRRRVKLRKEWKEPNDD